MADTTYTEKQFNQGDNWKLYSAITGTAGTVLSQGAQLLSVTSEVYDNQTDAYEDAAEKFADLIADQYGRIFTDFQINFITYPSASAGKTDMECRMTALFNSPE